MSAPHGSFTDFYNRFAYILSTQQFWQEAEKRTNYIPETIWPKAKITPYAFIDKSSEYHEDVASYVKYFILSDNLFQAGCIRKHTYWKHWSDKFPKEILFRLNLKHNGNAKLKSPEDASSAWLQHYYYQKEDKVFPARITSIENWHQEPTLLIIKTICGDCHHQFDVSFTHEAVKNRSTFLCPNCMAKIQFDKQEMKLKGENYFHNKLSEIPVHRDGKYPVEQVKQIFNLAERLKPLVLIKFGVFRVDGAHILGNTIFYEFHKRIGYTDPDSVDIIWTQHDWDPWNEFAFELNNRFIRHLHPIARAVAELLERDSIHHLERQILFPVYTALYYLTKEKMKVYRQVSSEFFNFTQEEIQQGKQALKNMGVPESGKYVCLSFRSSRFHQMFSINKYDRDHDKYNDASRHRNMSFENVRKVIEKLISKGYYVLLMGKEPPPEELDIRHELFIPYSSKYRTEFLDMYLFMHCHLNVGCGGAQAFTFSLCRDNTLLIDIPDIWLPEAVYPNTITIPKRIKWKNGNFLSLNEVLQTNPFANLVKGEELGLEMVDNNMEDIYEAIDEFVDIVEKNTPASPDIKEMMDAFYDLYHTSPFVYEIDHEGGRLASSFLKHYRHELLGDDHSQNNSSPPIQIINGNFPNNFSALPEVATWEYIKDLPQKKIYLSEIPDGMNQYDPWIGLSPAHSNKNHVHHALPNPLPLDENSVDSFLAEEILNKLNPNAIVPLIDHLFCLLKSGGLLRIAIPDYKCDLLYNRSQKDNMGNITFDPKGGGTPENPGTKWFPTYAKFKDILNQTQFHNSGTIEYLHYYDEDSSTVMHPIDYSLGFVERTPDHDPRVQNPKRPFSIVVDLRKN